jgi:hypothetical protein
MDDRDSRVGAEILIDLCNSLYSGARKLHNLALEEHTDNVHYNNAALVILKALN